MIIIMTSHDDKSTLDFLATECEYEVTISEIDGAVCSALCEGKDAGIKAIEVIDAYKLLADNNEPFPTILGLIYHIAGKTPRLGL